MAEEYFFSMRNLLCEINLWYLILRCGFCPALRSSKHVKCILCTPASQPYLAVSSLRPSSRLSPCSSSRETLRLRGLAGSGLPSSRAAGNSSTRLCRKCPTSSSILRTRATVSSQVNGVSGLTGHTWTLEGQRRQASDFTGGGDEGILHITGGK